MKKVLLIAYYYYQSESPASPRTYGLCQYLPKFGWEVTLLTVAHPNVSNSSNIISANEKINILNKIRSYLPDTSSSSLNIIHTSDVGMKNDNNGTLVSKIGCVVLRNNVIMKLLRAINNKLDYPDHHYGWYKSAVAAGLQILRKNKYDAIISTQSPFTAHMIGKTLKEKSGLPWVADYRDLWSQWVIINSWKSSKQHQKDYMFEKYVLSSADIITVVSEPWAKELILHHQKPTTIIPNGFDPATINSSEVLSPKFTIMHTGVIYARKRTPTMIYKAVRELIDENIIDIQKISLDFYGPNEHEFADDVSLYDLGECVEFRGIVSREKIIQCQRSSQILLLLTADDAIDVGCYPAKVFEYLAAKRPILSYGYNGSCVLSSLLEETNSGIHICSYSALKEQIKRWYLEYCENGYVSYHGNMEIINSYSQIGMAEKFAKVLDTCVSN